MLKRKISSHTSPTYCRIQILLFAWPFATTSLVLRSSLHASSTTCLLPATTLRLPKWRQMRQRCSCCSYSVVCHCPSKLMKYCPLCIASLMERIILSGYTAHPRHHPSLPECSNSAWPDLPFAPVFWYPVGSRPAQQV